MTHALNRFIQEQMDARLMTQADLVRRSGLHRSHVSKLVNDRRSRLSQLPAKDTIEGLARAFRVTPGVILSKAVEALDIGFEAKDFVYGLSEATDEELLGEIAQRLNRRSSISAYLEESEGGRREDAWAALEEHRSDPVEELVAQLNRGALPQEVFSRIAAERYLTSEGYEFDPNPLSVAPDNIPDAVAAHDDEDVPTVGEQGESDLP